MDYQGQNSQTSGFGHQSPGRSLYGRSKELEDPYGPYIVDDLLQGVNEWRNIQDIVRLTFKALNDVVKSQGEALRDIERQVPTKASKTEVQTQLANKANFNEITKQIVDLNSQLDQKVNLEDIQHFLEDKVSRSDLQMLLSHKVSIEEARQLLESKVNIRELESEAHALNSRIEELQKDTLRRIQSCATDRELQIIKQALEQKASLEDMNEQLESKANKQSVANALQRKANRADVEAALAKKVEIQELQTIYAAIEQKADALNLENVVQSLDQKIDRQEVQQNIIPLISQKAERNEVEKLHSMVQALRLDFEQKLNQQQNEYHTQLQSTRMDLENLRQVMQTSIQKKADQRDIEKLQQVLKIKADIEYVSSNNNNIRQEMVDQLNKVQIQQRKDKQEQEEIIIQKNIKNETVQQHFEEEILRLKEQIKIVSEERKQDLEETANYIKNLSNNTKKEIGKDTQQIQTQVEHLNNALHEIQQKKIDKQEFNDYKKQVVTHMEQKSNVQEVQDLLAMQQKDIANSLFNLREEIKQRNKKLEEGLYLEIESKVSKQEFENAISEKADLLTLQRQLQEKATLEDLQSFKSFHERISREIASKASATDLETHVQHTRNALEEVGKDMLLKANIKDICTLLDMKANIDDVNKALTEIHREIDNKANQEDVSNHINDQALINEAICAENCVGRWIWKSGEVRSGYAVPWEVQTVNTTPDNYLWEKDKTSILIVSGGLYQIAFGFYAKKKPTVQLLVNGEPVLSAVNSASYVIHHSSGKMKGAKHSSGNIAGLTLVDFLALPPRARVSISYTGEPGAEGFLGFRKL